MSSWPEFATNRSTGTCPETVAGALNSLLGNLADTLREPPPLSIATAYFNVGGFELLAPSLGRLGPVRLLLGSEPTDEAVRTTITPLDVRRAHRGDPRLTDAVDAHGRALAEERDLLGFGRVTDAAAERLIAWLRRGDVQVRRLEKGFLHGKAFIVSTTTNAVVAGSSNLTYAGLARNLELNLGVYQPNTVRLVTEWFEEQWDAAVDYDLAALYEARRVPHHPWEVFLRMLNELYGANLEVDLRTTNELGLSDFQIDGVWRAKRLLTQRRGVIIADEVGLGKTYLAGELIREAAIERRQKVLVIAPATLRASTWEPFLAEKNIRATVLSYEELVRELPRAGTSVSRLQQLDEYAMVVVDEAHNLRNAATHRADAMRELLGGPVPKDLVLLTATPVNNSLQDLQTLISYISPSDAEFADVDVPSLRAYFAGAMALDPDELSGRHLFEVLDAVAVRRTRRFIKTQYPSAEINGKRIVFPQAVVHRVDYSLGQVLPGFFDRLATALGADRDEVGSHVRVDEGEPHPDLGSILTMARYVPSRFLLTADAEQQYQVQNAGLLQSALLKRFESSAVAFASTVRTMAASHEHFLTALDQGFVLTGDALRAWVASDTDDVETLVDNLDEDERDNVDHASLYDVASLRAAVEADRELLLELGTTASAVTWQNDPKVAALVEAIIAIAEAARAEGIGDQNTRDRRKVLVFTYFADTAKYLHDALTQIVAGNPRLADYAGRIVMATGADPNERRKAIVGFAPRTAGSPGDEDLYDLAVATDVLSEGINLQQAAQIINYDLPWNPMRLVQRHGRVDRIGSQHAYIHLRCFFPDDELEALLNLEERLQRKLKQAAAAFGTGEVLPGLQAVDRVMTETREDIERLRAEDTSLFDDTSDAAASSEEFQRRLANAFRSTALKDRVLTLPWGAGTGIVRPGGPPGVVFCTRIADHPRPQFRYVPFTADPTADGRLVPRRLEGEPEINRELLVALTQADPRDPYTEPDLPASLIDAVFAAWPLAQQDIHTEWMKRTDPAVVEPRVPRIMRDAADLVRRHGDVLGDVQENLVARLAQDVEPRIQREIRRIVRLNESSPIDSVQALLDAANDLRLRVPPDVEPLPEIELDDIRLIAWVAIHAGDAEPGDRPV